MNNTLNSWTSGIANFLNMGRNQRENMTNEGNLNSLNDNQFWNAQSNNGRFVPYPNIQGVIQKDFCSNGSNFMAPIDYSNYSPSIPNFTTAAYTSISGLKQIVSITDIGPVVAHYYDFGKYVGLGGAIRFFLLCKQIKHSFINISLNEENINIKTHSPNLDKNSGFSYPLVIHNNKFHLFGTIPTLRYIAKKIGEYGIDTYRDYILDIFSESIMEWRNDLLLAVLEKMLENKIFEDSKEEVSETELPTSRNTHFTENINKIIEEIKRNNMNNTSEHNYYNNYLKNRRRFFKKVESILVSYLASPFIPLKGDLLTKEVVSERKDIPKQLSNCPSYSELFLFSIIYDDSVLLRENAKTNTDLEIPTEQLLKEFPKLNNLFNAIMAYPLITQWYKEIENPVVKEENEHTDNKLSTTSIKEEKTAETQFRKVTPKKESNDFEKITFNLTDNLLLNEPHTSNTVTYRLAPPKSQVIFPNSVNNPRIETPNIYQSSKSNNTNTNKLHPVRINNYEANFRPTNPQPNINLRLPNFSQLNNIQQVVQGQQISTARHYGNFNNDQRQSNQHPTFVPSTFR